MHYDNFAVLLYGRIFLSGAGSLEVNNVPTEGGQKALGRAHQGRQLGSIKPDG